MTKRVFLIDITRHMGPLQPAVQAARAHAETFSPSRVVWFRSAAQIIDKVEGEEQIAAAAEVEGVMSPHQELGVRHLRIFA